LELYVSSSRKSEPILFEIMVHEKCFEIDEKKCQ
jgi:hypothetical protein